MTQKYPKGAIADKVGMHEMAAWTEKGHLRVYHAQIGKFDFDLRAGDQLAKRLPPEHAGSLNADNKDMVYGIAGTHGKWILSTEEARFIFSAAKELGLE